jgi:phosphoadenosine phosphosulfate reductase
MAAATNIDVFGVSNETSANADGAVLSKEKLNSPKHQKLLALQNKFAANTANTPLEHVIILIENVIKEFGAEKVALFSSFGSYSALLLDVVAKINPNIAVLFLDTQKHFVETTQYVNNLEKNLNLKNLIRLTPDETIVANADKLGDLWSFNVDRCCWIRKVEPLDRHMKEAGYEAVITGRRSYQTAEREAMKTIELDDQEVFRINPFAFWSKDDVKREFAARGLQQHPLVAAGYPSIGCKPCTFPVQEGQDERAGRWAHLKKDDGEQKTECGIHLNRDDMKDWVI